MESTRSTSQINHHASRVIFFDGYCALCNRWVDFLIRNSAHLSFQVASLQGNAAKQIFVGTGRGDLLLPPFKSVILYEKANSAQGTVFLTESDAIIRIFELMEGKWKLLRIFKLIPRRLRNWIYQQISRNRYQWFGKWETCRLPKPEEKRFFLD